MRTIVEIPEEQLRGLSSLCKRERISRAEAIRLAVTQLLDEQKPSDTTLDAAFGLWKGRKIDAAAYIDRLRAEWP